jgi:hypothetical protein
VQRARTVARAPEAEAGLIEATPCWYLATATAPIAAVWAIWAIALGPFPVRLAAN